MRNIPTEFDLIMYKEGCGMIKFLFDSRYKILQFSGFYNAASLTLGVGQGVLMDDQYWLATLCLSTLSIIVSLMGLSNEYGLRLYNVAHFQYLRAMEEKYSRAKIESHKGIFSHGRACSSMNKVQKLIPVHRSFMIYHWTIGVSWTIFLLYTFSKHSGILTN